MIQIQKITLDREPSEEVGIWGEKQTKRSEAGSLFSWLPRASKILNVEMRSPGSLS